MKHSKQRLTQSLCILLSDQIQIIDQIVGIYKVFEMYKIHGTVMEGLKTYVQQDFGKQ